MALKENKETGLRQENSTEQIKESQNEENKISGHEQVVCPVNFNRLTLGALRKYQYKFRLRMGPTDKPLLTRTDLIEVISKHFAKEMQADLNDEIAKFLSLKREEARADLTIVGARRQGRTRGNRNVRPANNVPGAAQINNGVIASSANGSNSEAAQKTRTGGAIPS